MYNLFYNIHTYIHVLQIATCITNIHTYILQIATCITYFITYIHIHTTNCYIYNLCYNIIYTVTQSELVNHIYRCLIH